MEQRSEDHPDDPSTAPLPLLDYGQARPPKASYFVRVIAGVGLVALGAMLLIAIITDVYRGYRLAAVPLVACLGLLAVGPWMVLKKQ